MNVNDKYYDGFEGEPKITFCLVEDNIIVEKVGIWDGYFNEIMKMIQPEKKGWTGLAYYYHLYIGWYEEDEWMVPDALEAYEQLTGIRVDKLKHREAKETLILITNLLKKAVDNKGQVYITYD